MIGSRELWEEQQKYAEADNCQGQEEMEAQCSTCYCSGCQTNWATLPLADEEGDESYTFCPLCRTDEHLGEGRSGHTYRFDPITGSVISTLTGIARPFKYPEPPPILPLATAFDYNKYEAARNARELEEDRKINEYLKAQ